MALKLKLDDGRALRREQREARIALKRERRQARELKRSAHAVPIEVELGAASADLTIGGVSEEGDVAAAESRSSPARTETQTSDVAPAPDSAAGAMTSVVDDRAPRREREHAGQERGRVSRRERDVAGFLERRERLLREVREEARERIARDGEEQAVCDALGALAHSQAAPWAKHREWLSEAIAGGRIPPVGACARRACRGAASDAARTSSRAPDPDLALAVAVAYAVIARAPWAAVRGVRAQRNGAGQVRPISQRAFWR